MDGDVFSNIIGVFTLDTAMDMESQQHQVGLGGMFATGTMDRTTLARLEVVGNWSLALGTGKLASAIWGWRIVFGRRRTGVSAKVALFEVNMSTGHQRVCGSTKLQFWSALTLLRWPGFTRFPCTLWQRHTPRLQHLCIAHAALKDGLGSSLLRRLTGGV